jgi:glucokinase
MAAKPIVGVDVGGTNIKAALVVAGEIKKSVALPTRADKGLNVSIGQIQSAITSFSKEAHSIGIGIAGIVDSHHGVVKYSPNLKGWHDVKLAEVLTKRFKKTVTILNDVNAICIGEWKYGAARGYDNVFLFTVGTGVGGAAVCEGNLVFGAHGFAGEFGHIVIDYNGPRCTCGNRGHLERYAGARFIIARARKKMKKKKSSLHRYSRITPEIIAEEARRGDNISRQVFAEIGFYIGIGVANVINLLDPDVIVISGGISRAGTVLFEPIRKTVAERALGTKYRTYKIIPAKLGDDAGILGAAYFTTSCDR